MLQNVHSSWHACASWEFLKLPTAVLSEPAVAPSPRWQRGVMQIIPIHDLTPSALDTRRTWLRPLETGRCSCGLQITVTREPLGQAQATRYGCHDESAGYPVIAWRLAFNSPGYGHIAHDYFHSGVDLFTDCTLRLPGGSRACRADLAVTSPVNSLWLGLAHLPRPLVEPDDVSDSDNGKGKGKGNDDDDNGGGGGGDGGDGECDGDKGLGSRNRSRSPPASAKARTGEAPPLVTWGPAVPMISSAAAKARTGEVPPLVTWGPDVPRI